MLPLRLRQALPRLQEELQDHHRQPPQPSYRGRQPRQPPEHQLQRQPPPDCHLQCPPQLPRQSKPQLLLDLLATLPTPEQVTLRQSGAARCSPRGGASKRRRA